MPWTWPPVHCGKGLNIMKNVMGLIYTGENDASLRELTMLRAVAALPVGGRYRVIDFIMSSMVNSGIKKVGVIMQKNYHSLMDHLGSGKEWDLHGKNDGLYVLPPFLTRENVGVYNGSLDAIRSNSNYLDRSKEETVVLCSSNIIFNADMQEMIRAHQEGDADITMMYTRNQNLSRSEYGTYIKVDENNKISDIEVDPTKPSYDCIGMEVFVLRKDLLRHLVDQGVAHGYHHFTRELLQGMLHNDELKFEAYEYKGPTWRIDSVQSYFKFNLDMLNTETRHSLFSDDLPVYTKVRDEMPASYGDQASVVNSLIADGCVVEGKVENSILFRGVRIAPDAHVKNCIIMQDGVVQSGAHIENCILDKQAVIKMNARLIGPAAYPIVIAKNVVI